MKKILTIIGFSTILFASCSSYDKVLKSNDHSLKLSTANQYYEEGRWFRANELYASLIPVLRATKNFEEVMYRYAYSYFNMKDYLTASYQFKNFLETFPKSTRAEEMRFMYAKSLYLDSPKTSLDPTNTREAMNAMASYIKQNPGGKYITEATSLLDELSLKLIEKDQKAAKLYYDMGQYRAARIAYTELIDKYPTSKINDYHQFMVVKSTYLFANKSYDNKKEERMVDVVNAFQTMKDYFPNSTYFPEAEKYYTLAQNSLKQIQNGDK